MINYSEFYSAIDNIADHMRTDFIGPIHENEVIDTEDPLSRYSVGILWAQKKNKTITDVKEDEMSEEELFEDELQEDEKVLSINNLKPSTMAISFAAKKDETINIEFKYGTYFSTEEIVEKADNSEYTKYSYTRKQNRISIDATVPDKTDNIDISDFSHPVKVYLHVRKAYEDGSRLVTVSVSNANKCENDLVSSNTSAFFQCSLHIKNKNGFLPVSSYNSSKSHDEKVTDMLYDEVKNYSSGHGCATMHTTENGIVTEIRSEFVPYYRLLQMMPRILKNSEYLYMQYWQNANRYEACDKLSALIDSYEKWSDELKENYEIIKKYPEVSSETFEKIQQCVNRLRNGIECLRENDTAWKSFVYMNEAMCWQRVKTKGCPHETVSWYPFQMAYILQIIPDIVDNKNPFHDCVDLLWFPTGGGKTEAYLGVSAFTVFFRRLSGKTGRESDGVTIIMRYTLRLLTIQQFERAAALICACEYMRKKYALPGNEISIGLWIGSGMTPNHLKDAEETIKKIQEDSTVRLFEANPMQITKCPWCGADIQLGGYSIDKNGMNICCHNNPDCDFHKHLPVYVVDDDIYNKKPTLLLSTVDKFARITWEEKAGNLFGAEGNKPPELVIQDELHLISGPLGSITGIYEIAVDEICRHYGGAPKIIASTATVKNASQQIKILYNKNMIQFPPNGLSYADSFFAVQADEEKRPARTYLGICSGNSHSSEIFIKIFALLIFLKYLYKNQNKPVEVIDQFFTTVGYFNTLKELGTSSNIITDRIYNEIKYIAYYKFNDEAVKYNIISDNKINIPPFIKYDELTSRNTAKQIKDVLEKLGRNFTKPECYDYVMSSNMLSVGIDIDRLGVMCVYGQPKSNSEYIQATSRVGRTNPGLVIPVYNGLRSRDKSYFEQFTYYHSTFYKYVEATSVTSYSPRAIEKALHCAFMAIIRHTIPKYNSNLSAGDFDIQDRDIQKILQKVVNRVNDIEPRMSEYSRKWLEYYLECWDNLMVKLKGALVYYDYTNEDRSLFKSGENKNGSDIPTVLNSVRNVETSSDVYFTKR